ncbi:hypothetical protein AYL99_08355 [Fonsecaea erecta]|uniref:Dihydrodipicolinate synthase n=1 Tax=Fonsecaea erecta TaxID=1367422 RepID=A0A178ZCW2_9EURO|nr:hypothetical protein AYL99_08355 [Fonsecaea erecta]OAP57617.1 hypothetical protein AYL99_08355 [Fonsecaea erecta]
MAGKAFPPGVYAPSLTWFSSDPQQEIDYVLQARHTEYLVRSGLTGVVIAGSNGEAVALSNAERLKLISLTREIAIRNDRPDMPVVIGTVGQATKEIIAQLSQAKLAGADYGLVLTPSYFHFAMNPIAIENFFAEVADASPIPILIYSWPLVTSGIEINSDIMAKLGKHPNIVGTKLTCGGIAKLARIAADFGPEDFCALAGHSEWLLPALSVGGTGCISGFANLCPKACVEIYRNYKEGKVDKARELQFSVAKAEWWLNKTGINGTKWIVARLLGYDESKCATRRPYPLFTDIKAQQDMLAALAPIRGLEK